MSPTKAHDPTIVPLQSTINIDPMTADSSFIVNNVVEQRV